MHQPVKSEQDALVQVMLSMLGGLQTPFWSHKDHRQSLDKQPRQIRDAGCCQPFVPGQTRQVSPGDFRRPNLGNFRQIRQLPGVPQKLSTKAKQRRHHACLVLVLQRVALHDRLARCALVSRLWASAAAAATASINYTINRDVVGRELHPSMLKYLRKHGHAVTSITAVQPDFDPNYFGAHVELPCAVLTNLCSLSLEGMWVELAEGHGSKLSTATKAGKRKNHGRKKGARNGHHAASAMLSQSCVPAVSKGNTTVTKAAAAAGANSKPVRQQQDQQLAAPTAPTSDTVAIQLGRMGLVASTGSPAPQAVLPRLQDLRLVDCAVTGLQLLPRITSFSTLVLNNLEMEVLQPEISFPRILEETLQKLAGLSELRFTYSPRNRPALRRNTLDAVTSMQRLQQLELTVSGKLDLSFLGRLPASLTALHLQAEGQQDDVHSVLDLYDAPLLQRLTGLQELSLERIIIDPSKIAILSSSLTSLQLEAVVGTPEIDAPKLFESMQQLPRLRHLALAGNFWSEFDDSWPLQSLSALTAASSLTALHLYSLDKEQPLPTGALCYILPAGKQLPNLKVLRIACNPGSGSLSCEHDDGDCWCVDGDDINRLATSCPSLEQLTLHSVVTLNLDRSCLAQLPSSLHTLSLGGAAFDKAAAHSVATLTGLKCLHWCDNLIKDKELRVLTALTQLTELHVTRCPWLSARIMGGEWTEWKSDGTEPGLLLQQATEGDNPAVWQQLQQLYSKQHPDAKVGSRTVKSSGPPGR